MLQVIVAKESSRTYCKSTELFQSRLETHNHKRLWLFHSYVQFTLYIKDGAYFWISFLKPRRDAVLL